MSNPIFRYKAMAYLVGTLLVLLVVVGVPLQYAGGHPVIVNIVGPIHGFSYLVYLLVSYDLVRRYRLGLWPMIVIALAGLVPFMTFIVERRTARRVEAIDGQPSSEDVAPVA